MTKRESDSEARIAISFLSRCTVDGVEQVKRYHGHTVQLLRWYKQGFVEILPAAVPALQALCSYIRSIAQDTRLVRPVTVQPTLDWEQVTL